MKIAPQAASTDYGAAFPHSTKVYEEKTVNADGAGNESPRITLRVPAREVALSGGEPPVRLYDTSGPQGHDVRDGLP